jgi:hypothetical protein
MQMKYSNSKNMEELIIHQQSSKSGSDSSETSLSKLVNTTIKPKTTVSNKSDASTESKFCIECDSNLI